MIVDRSRSNNFNQTQMVMSTNDCCIGISHHKENMYYSLRFIRSLHFYSILSHDISMSKYIYLAQRPFLTNILQLKLEDQTQILHFTYSLTMTISILWVLLVTQSLGYTNPVQSVRDSPDPGVIHHQGSYYAVTTEGWDSHYFPIWKSQTGTNFTQVGWVFPSPPSWTACCDYWAPQLHIINGHFLVYFTARDKSHKLTIGAATSTHILGPYTDKGGPLVTNSSEGVIDATVLRDGNNNYIVYKVDGNAHGHQTQFWAVLLDPTGMGLVGQPKFLMKNDQQWQHGIIEGQWFVQHNQTYYLFYSGCGYANDCYSVGVAKSSHPLGPYIKNPSNPILKTRSPQTNQSWEGPGHCSVVQSPGGEWLMFYHAWPHGKIGTKRLILLDKVTFSGDWPSVNDGSPSEGGKPDPKVESQSLIEE